MNSEIAGEREEYRRRKAEERGDKTLARFQSSTKGLRKIFEKHFPGKQGEGARVVFHLAKAEAQLPNVREAIRLARYPGAGDRGARQFVMGLWENLRFLERHLTSATAALEGLAYDPDISGPLDVDTETLGLDQLDA